MIKKFIQFEGLAIFIASLYFYNLLGTSWIAFILLFMVPDISMIGYLKDSKLGAVLYNLVHNYILALFLIFFGLLFDIQVTLLLGIVLASHIGLDRFLGFGLKYPIGFKHTHIDKL